MLAHLPRSKGKSKSHQRQSQEASRTVPASRRWGVVLAGGDGVRLRSLTRLICGDDRPKQFCPLLGETALVEQARHRAERSIAAERILFVVTRTHQDYYLGQLSRPLPNRIVQPNNRGTAPAILYSLLSIAQEDRNAIVAILPSDHYYSDESAFALALDSAFQTAAARPRSIVLLGAQPNGPEVEYGWIETGTRVHAGLFRVHRFHEKPPLDIAERLFQAGALWNTFVMVGRLDAFLKAIWAAAPGLMEVFQASVTGFRSNGEIHVSNSLYDWVSPMDFSRQILSPAAKHLVTLRLGNVEWHDLGDPERVLSTLIATNAELPVWARRWQSAHRAGVDSASLSESAAAS